MANPVLDAIFTRRSVRSYTKQKPSDEQVETLIKAALASPSARNSMPWQIIVADDESLIGEMESDVIAHLIETGDLKAAERLKRHEHLIFYEAPLVFFIAVRETDYAQLDAGILAENLSIAATSMGLGSIILGYPRFAFKSGKANYWREKLKIADGYDFTIAVAVGHTESEGKPHSLDYSRVTRL